MSIVSFKEYLLEKVKFEDLKKNKVPLSKEEREECIKADAVWHGRDGRPEPAVWKSVDKDGNTTYITNTHRAWQSAPTLKGAIKKYHDFIKGTA